MPPKSTYTKNPKKRAALDKARRARLSCGQGNDEYVHNGSSLSDAESAEEAIGDTSPGIIIYISVIY
jgi:hypothetical protein